jgi:MoaF C-terminal domain/MoaF N-terminal domain
MNANTETPGFVHIADWPTPQDLCDGFSEYLLPESKGLSGKQYVLIFEDGTKIEHHFVDDQKLVWCILGGSDRVRLSEDAKYKAIEVRPNVFFVDFNKPGYQEQVSIVLDVSSGQAVAGTSGFHDVNGSRRTYTKFANAHIKGFESVKPYRPTEELIGKHILYRYTGDDAYEHLYLNEGTFTWHCLSGTEKGLADTEPCKMLKLGEKLYLLFWTEKIMPVDSIVVIDLERMRSTGRFYCWDPTLKKAAHTMFGSYATILAESNARKLIT